MGGIDPYKLFVFHVDKRTLLDLKGFSRQAEQTNRRDGVGYREQRDHEVKLFNWLVVSPKALGVLLIAGVFPCVAAAMRPRGSFIWLVAGFLMAHAGAYLMGLFLL